MQLKAQSVAKGFPLIDTIDFQKVFFSVSRFALVLVAL